jgi:putative transposase
MIDVPWSQRNWRKTQDKIAAIHEKIARRGRAFNHYQSTRLVRQFDQIFLEDYRVSEVVGKVDPIDSGRLVVNVNDELTTIYEKNGRKLNRDTNRAALRNRVGQLWTMIETKGGKKVVRVERAGTSNECPNCGHIKEKTLKVRTHRCEVCGFVAPRDVAAALVIKKRGLAGTHSCQKSEPKQKRQKRGRKKDSDEMSA